jgi:hypothetical protein
MLMEINSSVWMQLDFYLLVINSMNRILLIKLINYFFLNKAWVILGHW